MDDEKKIYVVAWSTVFLCCVMCGALINLYFIQQKAYDSLSICNATMIETTGINGIWFSEGYYCVWAAGENLKTINETDKHEACHALVNSDYNHFCAK